MSYNIDSVDILSAEGFMISRDELAILSAVARRADPGPPDCSVFDLLENFLSAPDAGFVFGESPRHRFDWQGEGSGHAFEMLKMLVLPAFHGKADLLICWEGGDAYTGLRLVNGVVTEHEVITTLGKEIKEDR